MTATISQRIALEGGKAIIDELKAIGVTGEGTFKKINAAAANNTGWGVAVGKAINQVKASLAGVPDAAHRFKKSLDEMGDAADTLGKRVGIISGTIIGLGAAFTIFLESSGAAAEELINAAASLGTPTKQFQEMKAALDIVGVKGEQFQETMNHLNDSMTKTAEASVTLNKGLADISSDASDARTKLEAAFSETLRHDAEKMAKGSVDAGEALDTLADGARHAADQHDILKRESERTTEAIEKSVTALGKLGISVGEVGNLRAPLDVLNDLADVFHDMPDGADKTAIAIDVLGLRAGPRLIPLLNQGRGGFAAYAKDAEHLGAVLTDLQLGALKTMDDAFDRLKIAVAGVKDEMAAAFAPVVTTAVNRLTEVIASNRQKFIDLAGVIADKVEPVIRDIILMLGGAPDSAINTKWLITARDDFIAFGTAVKDVFTNVVKPAFDAFMEGCNFIARLINKVFGTDITGAAVAVTIALGFMTGGFAFLVAAVGVAVTGFGFLLAIFAPVSTVVLEIAAAFATLATFLLEVPWGTVAQVFIDAWHAAQRLFGEFVDWVKQKWSDLVAWFKQKIHDIVQPWVDAWNDVKNWVADTWEAIKKTINDALNSIKANVSEAINSVKNLWTDLESWVKGIFDNIMSWFRSIIQGAADAKAAASGVGGGGGFSGGGSVHGPGTSTSDSIPARLSTGEWVIKAKAVSKYGSSLFAALNSMRINRTSVANFAVGGLIQPSPVVNFASGGVVSDRRRDPHGVAPTSMVNLHIGNRQFPLLGPADVVESLVSVIKQHNLASAGRVPRAA